MSILKHNILPKTPQSPDKQQLLKQVSNRIINFAEETFNNCVRSQREGVDLVFNNPNLTAQEILDHLGEKAIKVFQYHEQLTDFIAQIAKTDGVNVELKKIPQSYTVNLSAGSITLID